MREDDCLQGKKELCDEVSPAKLRKNILRKLDQKGSWKDWLRIIRQESSDLGETDRQIEFFLRVDILSKAFIINDPALPEELSDSVSFRKFLGVKKKDDLVLDMAALALFRNRLSMLGLHERISEEIALLIRQPAAAQSYRTEVAHEGITQQAQKLAEENQVAGKKPEKSLLIEYTDETDKQHAADSNSQVESCMPDRTDESQPGNSVLRSPPDKVESLNSSRVKKTVSGGHAGSLPTAKATVRKKRMRQSRNMWPAALLMITFIVGTYFYGLVLYQRARAKVRDNIPYFSFLAPTSNPYTEIPKSATPDPALYDTTPVPTLRISPYDASIEIETNVSALSDGIPPAAILKSERDINLKASVTLDGLLDYHSMCQLIDIVKQHEVKVSFFPAARQAADAPNVLEEIVKAGLPVGNYTLCAEPHMENKPVAALVEDFTAAQKILRVITGNEPVQIKCNATEYTQNVLIAAAASGIQQAVRSTSYLTFHSFKSYEETLGWVNRQAPGSIISVKLSGLLDSSEYRPSHSTAKPIGAEVTQTAQPSLTLTPEERTVQLVAWLLRAIEEADFSWESVGLREANQGRLAEPVMNLKTSIPSVAYIFYGNYAASEEIDGVLKSLAALKGKANFYVSETDLHQYPHTIKKILDHGHSLGIAWSAARHDDYFSVTHRLLKIMEQFEDQLGLRPMTLMQPFGGFEAPLEEAASAMGLTLVQQDLSFVREEGQNAIKPDDIISVIYKDKGHGFHRGAVIGFRLGYYQHEQLLQELLMSLQGTRNAYKIDDVFSIATDTHHLYTYPLTQKEILPEVYNSIRPGYLALGKETLSGIIQRRYIGTPIKSSSRQLPGLSWKEINKMDTTGRIKGTGNTVFLTFDDWGNDIGVTKLLSVLKKHDVKATFFVRTNYVPNNPNLLRAIAMDGHEIASHTNSHIPLSVDTQVNWRYLDLDEAQVLELQEDLIKSWQILQSIVGDIRLVNGQPALSRNFRPPTLAVGKNGMRTVYDLGFDYIVNGYLNSGDYDVTSKDKLLLSLKNRMRGGAVVIMHFSDNSIYTADALDDYFNYNKQENETPFKFARLSDYLSPIETADGPASEAR